ncbi:MAG TPA: replication-relaxation family protein [Nitrospiraceae bacterium]|nr:replication-relaxation family protein [Nitrospiraceae bacterium]
MTAPIVLTARDIDLMESLATYRYLSTPQVQRLHFPSAQTALRRLRRLSEAGLLSTFRSPACTDRIATITPLGSEVLSERLGRPIVLDGKGPRRTLPKDYLFLLHFLAVSDFRITLTRACAARNDLSLLGFIPEHRTERSSTGTIRKYIGDRVADGSGSHRVITHAPDGVFALAHAGRAALFFLEIDRGTEVISNPEKGFLRMVRFYLTYLRDGGYQRYREDFGVEAPFRGFRTLVVSTTAARLQNIRKSCGRVAFDQPRAKRFVWLSDAQASTDPDVLSRRWTPLEPDDDCKYSIIQPCA